MLDIKVVILVKGDRATIGVQAPNTDPVVETVPIVNQEDALQKAFVAATGLVERAQQRWASSPKNPAYQRPPPPPVPETATGGPRAAAPSSPPKPVTSRPQMF